MQKHPLLNLLRANAGRGRKFKVELPKNDAGEVIFWLYDAIGVNPWDGSGIDPLEVAQALAGLNGAPVRFRIHSPGGDAFDGRAIATAIGAYSGPTAAQVDGYAASAASYVALAADKVEMAPGSFFMIHEGWTIAFGNKGDMLQVASMLETFDNSIIADYVRQTGNSVEQVTAWLEAETWFEAADALKFGFADSVLGDVGDECEDDTDCSDNETCGNDGYCANNRFDLSIYGKVPKALLARKPKAAAPLFDPAAHAARNRLANVIKRRALASA